MKARIDLDRPSAAFTHRRPRRAALFLEAILRRDAHSAEVVQIKDISASGFSAVGGRPLPEGAGVRIQLPGFGMVQARVKWSDGTAFGAEFTGPADLRRLFLAGLAAPYCTWMREAA